MRHFLIYTVMVFLAIGAANSIPAAAQNTTRKNLKTYPKALAKEKNLPDTLHLPATDSIFLSGYEKAQSSTKETFFVTNNSSCDIEKIHVTLTYTDIRGSILHKRDIDLELDLSAGETRHVSQKFWDPHKLWYYVGTQSKPNAYSTPFDVSYKIAYAIKKANKGK